MTKHREIDFISTDWVERAAWWPGLQVYSQPVRVPVDVSRREGDACVALVDVIEQLLREALLPVPFESVDLDKTETLLNTFTEPLLMNTVA